MKKDLQICGKKRGHPPPLKYTMVRFNTTHHQLVIVRGNPEGEPADAWFERRFGVPSVCEKSETACCFMVENCYIQQILTVLQNWKSTNSPLIDAVTVCRYGNMFQLLFENGFCLLTPNGKDLNEVVYAEIRLASNMVMNQRAGYVTRRATSVVSTMQKRHSRFFLGITFREWARLAKTGSRRKQAVTAFSQTRATRRKKTIVRRIFSHWKTSFLRNKTAQAQKTARKAHASSGKLKKANVLLREKVAEAEAIGSAQAHNQATTEEIMKYAKKIFPHAKPSALVESFRRASRMVGGDLHVLVDIAVKLHEYGQRSSRGSVPAERMKGMLHILSTMEEEELSLRELMTMFTMMRFGACDPLLGKKFLPETWNKMAEESALAYCAFCKRNGKSLLEIILESKVRADIHTCMMIISINMQVPLAQLRHAGGHTFEELLNAVWVKMAGHERSYVIRVKTLTEAKIAIRAIEKRPKPFLSLGGIPVRNNASFKYMMRMFECYREKTACGDMERKLLEKEPKEAMRLIQTMKAMVEVETFSKKRYTTIEDYFLLKGTDYAMRIVFLLKREACFEALHGLMGVTEDPKTEKAKALHNIMREHIQRSPDSLKRTRNLLVSRPDIGADLVCLCKYHIQTFLIPYTRHNAVEAPHLKNKKD